MEIFNSGAVLPGGTMEEIDRTMNCEDIIMNCVVGRFLELVSWAKPTFVVVEGKGDIKCKRSW